MVVFVVFVACRGLLVDELIDVDGKGMGQMINLIDRV